MKRLVAWVALIGGCATAPIVSDRVVAIETAAPGMSAEQVERGVTVPLERALNTLVGVVSIHSVSTEGAVRIELSYRVAPSAQQVASAEAATWAAQLSFVSGVGRPAVSVQARRLVESQPAPPTGTR